MNIDMSPRIRTVVSGLAAVATTALLMTTVIESLNPAALQRSRREAAAPVNTAVADARSDAPLIRRV
jgi:hypothetical protein